MAQASAAGGASQAEYVLRTRRRAKVVKTVGRSVIHVVLVVGSITMIIPLFWMVSTSLKQEWEAFVIPMTWLPETPLWSNYTEAIFDYFSVPLYTRNTLIITIGAGVGRLLSASLVAYGFARIRFFGRNFFFMLALGTMMIPGQVTIIPIFIIFKELGWLETFLPLIVPAWFGGGAFFIFMIRQFIMTINPELDDAARIDGAGWFGIYWRVILPLIRPALGTVAIFSFLGTWNDFFGPLIYLRKDSLYTLGLGLHYMATAASSSIRPNTVITMAGGTLMIIPPLLVFFFAQRYFVQGVVITGVKG